MTVSIIANSAAQFAQSAIKTRNESLALNSQKISSGLRVFRASEDPAALAVGTSIKIDNKGYGAALLNVGSGVSMLQIAEGALGQVSDILVRMQVLASQASSGQLDDSSRALVDMEFQGLKAEVDRIAQVTNFNGVKMLAGSKNFDLVSSSNISVDGISGQKFDQTLVTGDQTFRYSYDATTEQLTLSRVDGATPVTQTIDLTALLDVNAGQGENLPAGQTLEVGFSNLGVTMTLDSNFDRTVDLQPADTLTPGADIAVAVPSTPATATGPYFTPSTSNLSLDVLTALNGLTTGYNGTNGALTLPVESDGTTVVLGAVPGVSYVVNGGTPTAVGAASDDLVAASALTDAVVDIYVDVSGTGPVKVGTWTAGQVTTAAGGADGTLALGIGKGLFGAEYVDDNGPTDLTYKIGVGVVNGQDTLHVTIPAVTKDSLGLTDLNVLTAGDANTSIDALKAALTTLSQSRATVGAQQSRMEQVAANLGVLTENNERARSALLDVDVASEITEFTTNQAMMQAGVSMLSRANQLPDMLLQLLKN